MRIIREYIPFIMLAITSLSSVLSYFEIYFLIENYLSDIVGYSIITNLFMLTVYSNSRYCYATIMAVWGLMIMNVLNIVLHASNLYSIIYDFYITMTISVIFIILLITKKSLRNVTSN